MRVGVITHEREDLGPKRPVVVPADAARDTYRMLVAKHDRHVRDCGETAVERSGIDGPKANSYTMWCECDDVIRLDLVTIKG